MLSSQRLPRGSIVLLTGASGFIGSSIAQELLEAGFIVRGAGRNPSNLTALQAKFERTYGKGTFEAVQIKDYTDSATIEKHMSGVSGVIHTATDTSWGVDFDTVVNGTIDSTLTLMKIAAKFKDVKSFVYTSSRIAAFAPQGDRIVATKDTWLDELVPMAKNTPVDDPSKPVYVYAASKVLTEKATWDFFNKVSPGYTFNTVLPDYVIGKVVNPHEGNYSTNTWLNEFFRGIFNEDSTFYQFTNPASMYVDVIDAARAHVIALADDNVSNERIFAMVDTFSVAEVAEAIKAVHPHHKLPDYSKSAGRSDITAPNQRFKSLLKDNYGATPFTLKESVARNILDA